MTATSNRLRRLSRALTRLALASAAVVVKHTNPCGVASAASLSEAYRTAREADAVSAFGGIVALNREVDPETATILSETFLECVVAPSFSAGSASYAQRYRAPNGTRLFVFGDVHGSACSLAR